MRRFLCLSIAIFIFIVGCNDQDDELNGVQIRVKNVSTLVYDTIQVGNDEMIHSDLGPNDYSEYLIYESAYEYAYINISSEGESYILQPIDFVGEAPLPFGFYTYEVGINTDGQVTLNFTID